MRQIRSILLALALLGSASSHAQVYLGATGGIGGLGISAGVMPFSGIHSVVRLFGGWQFNQTLGTEVTLLFFERTSESGSTHSSSQEASGVGISAVAGTRIGRWRWSAKLGLTQMDAEVQQSGTFVQSFDSRASGTAPLVGVSVAREFENNLSLVFEFHQTRLKFDAPLNVTTKPRQFGIGVLARF